MNKVVAGASMGHTLRFAVVAILVLAMLIPLAFVHNVTAERQRYFDAAAADIAASWGGPFGAGTGQGWPGEGVHANAVAPAAGVPAHFTFEVTLLGSGTLAVTPVGATSEIDMASSWPHPSFTGRFLPNEHEIGPQGFDAHWVVHELAGRLPASWVAFSMPWSGRGSCCSISRCSRCPRPCRSPALTRSRRRCSARSSPGTSG